MNARTRHDNINECFLLDTQMLCQWLNLGRNTAIKIGNQANAKFIVGKSVRWKKKRIEDYLDSINTLEVA